MNYPMHVKYESGLDKGFGRWLVSHHYRTDERGLITMANLIVATRGLRPHRGSVPALRVLELGPADFARIEAPDPRDRGRLTARPLLRPHALTASDRALDNRRAPRYHRPNFWRRKRCPGLPRCLSLWSWCSQR
jgi:hypothetical protein